MGFFIADPSGLDAALLEATLVGRTWSMEAAVELGADPGRVICELQQSDRVGEAVGWDWLVDLDAQVRKARFDKWTKFWTDPRVRELLRDHGLEGKR